MYNRAQQIVTRSDPGTVREINEDRVAALPECGLIVVADGMGGYNAGDVASQLAVDVIVAQVRRTASASAVITDVRDAGSLLQSAVAAANEAIWRAANREPDCRGMGTTVVTGVFCGDRLVFSHVGDSRLYRWRNGRLDRLTRDHSMIQELVERGMFSSVEEARQAGVMNNVLTRALGIDETVDTPVSSIPLRTGDCFLFCTDGLTNMLTDAELEQRLTAAPGDMDRLADGLIAEACGNGGTDNISLALVRASHIRQLSGS